MRSSTPEVRIEDVDSDMPGYFSSDDEPSLSQNETHDVESYISQLQSSDQAELLSAIDKLRRENIDAAISIPQIVVCGDQSSGKSSVLEAIANVPFPVSNGTTTRFATEVILRQAPTTHIKVSIAPSWGRTPDAKRHLAEFSPGFEVSGGQDFGRLIQVAGEYLRAFEPGCRFWCDRLRAEISGPDQPHLTLVDLPGIIHQENGENAAPGDKGRIKQLLTRYLENERTIVLAVINATADLELQEIGQLVARVSNAKQRTLGVITKPDRLETSGDQLNDVLHLARNETLHLGLGWHVLRNLPHEDRDRSPEHRNEVETSFFSTGVWSGVSRVDVGIERLRRKLRDHIFRCIAMELPELIMEMRSELRVRQDTLGRLGPGRESTDEQKAYLSQILLKLQRLIEAGLEGDYEKAEFDTFFDGAEEKGIRDRINNDCLAFAHEMRESGKQYHIYGDISERDSGWNELPLTAALNFFPPYTSQLYNSGDGILKPVNVELHKYCTALATYMRQSRGKSLPGLLSFRTIKAVFRQLSVPWGPIVRTFVEKCYNAAQDFLKMAIYHIAGAYTGEALMREYVYPAFDQKSALLDSKIAELLWPFQKSHPITLNPSFGGEAATSGSRAINGEAGTAVGTAQTDVPLPWATIARDINFSLEEVDAANALDQTEAYYEVSDLISSNRVLLNQVVDCLKHFHRKCCHSSNRGLSAR